MQVAIRKIDRRINDLQSFDISSINSRDDPRIGSLEDELDTLLVSVFGSNTVEYERYRHTIPRIDTAQYNYAYEVSLQEVREGLERGVATSIESLNSIKSTLMKNLKTLV